MTDDNPYALPEDAEPVQESEPYQSIALADLFTAYIETVLPGTPPDDIRVRRARQTFMRGCQAAMYCLHTAFAHSQKAFKEQNQDLAIELNRWIDETEEQATEARRDSLPRIVTLPN